MRIFDSHCHFDFIEFNADRAALWQACHAHGVTRLLMPGVTPGQWQTAAQLCAQYDGLFYAAGIHPHWIERQPWFDAADGNVLSCATQDQIATLIRNELTSSGSMGAARCVAVGECGVDKMITTPLQCQEQLLVIHIELANQLQKPLIVHCVRAHNELIALLKKHKPEFGGVIHAFSGSYEVAQQYVDLGFYLGIGGTITYERAQKTRAAITRIPLAFLVLETDAPDMPVSGQQGMRNSPLNIVQIAQTLAALRCMPVAEVAKVTWENTCRLFHCD